MAAEATPDYEFSYILDGVLADDQIKELVARINKYITDNGGEVVDSDEWGMRPLAYSIRNRSNGYYVNLHFKSAPDFPAKLERTLRIEESILRYLVLKLDSKMKRHYHKQKANREAAPADQDAQPRHSLEAETESAES